MKEGFFSDKGDIDIRIRFYVVFGIAGGLILLFYAISNIIIHDYVFFVIEATLSIFSFYLSYQAFKSKSIKLASDYGMIPIFVMSVTNFMFGGYEGTGILWTFLLPPVLIFITGSKKGLTNSVLFLFISAIHVFIIIKYLPNTQKYSLIEFLTFVLSFSSITLIAWLFQKAWDTSDAYLQKEKSMELKFKDDLITKVNELQKVKQELETSLEKTQEANRELKKVNSIIIGRELKMVELKDKIKDLEQSTQK